MSSSLLMQPLHFQTKFRSQSKRWNTYTGNVMWAVYMYNNFNNLVGLDRNGSKFNSKTCSFAKIANMSKKKFSSKTQNGYQTTRFLKCISRIRWKSYINFMQKSDGKMEFLLFSLFLVYNFLVNIYFIPRYKNQRQILFFTIYWIFAKNCRLILALFANFEGERAWNGSKNKKMYFLNFS
jgi:hypothetical protein